MGTHPTGAFLNAAGRVVAKLFSDNSYISAMVKPMKGPVAWPPFMAGDTVDTDHVHMFISYRPPQNINKIMQWHKGIISCIYSRVSSTCPN